MASSSSTGGNPQWKYDVFLSFRGMDTRDNFTAHLYDALCRNHIDAYIDYQLRGGEKIEPALLERIEESYISVVIFSTNYADSTFCLRELFKILEYKETKGQEVIPVFHRVDPSHVQALTGSFGDALAEHIKDAMAKVGVEFSKEELKSFLLKIKEVICWGPFYGDDPSHVQELTESFGDALVKYLRDALAKHGAEFSSEEWESCLSKITEVASWGHALIEIANLKGWDSNVTKPETLPIKEIVSDISKKLEQLMSLSDSQALVGIDSRVKKVESLLHIGSLNVHTVGIVGMGGIGKTTIADVVFHRISDQFEGRCFLPNVREKLEKCTLVDLRDRILSEVLEKDNLAIGTLRKLPTHLTRKLQRKKILIVLDDVSSPQQLKALVGEEGLFGQGSRIIVTSRNRQVLRNVKAAIYEVEHLSYHEALQLFTSRAFPENPPVGEYRKLSKWMASHCKGVPLVLKVLGSDLCDKDIEYWKGEKEKIEGTGALDMEIQKCLRTSFDGLEETQQKIFLDISCFFKSFDKDRLQGILRPCEFHPTTGISILHDKCLINISENKIEMHDLLQQLGQDIVCEVKDPRKRSRLWVPKDIVGVLTHPQGTETIEAISLDTSRIKEMKLGPTVFQEMHNLRLLDFCNPKCKEIKMNLPKYEEIKMNLPEGLNILPNKLVLLYWDQYPLKSLPSKFCAENLFELRLSYSQLGQVWDECPPLENLKVLDLSYSRSLIRIPDFCKVPNLEELKLSGCTSLYEIPSSIDEYCSKLAVIDLCYCENLRSFPSCCSLTSLNHVCLLACPKIVEFPKVHCNIKELNLARTAIEKVPSSIGDLSQLVTLKMQLCRRLERLPSNIGLLKCLKYLNLSGCSKLTNLPSSICDLKSLEKLVLLSCPNVNGLPENLGKLKSLEVLVASELSSEDFDCESCEGLKLPPFAKSWCRLTSLCLPSCAIAEIPSSLGLLVSLRELDLSENTFESIPSSIKQLSKLTSLRLECCQSLRRLPQLPSSLKRLDVSMCFSLESVESIFTPVPNEYEADNEMFAFVSCLKLKQNDISIKIMDEATFRIKRLATSLFIQGYDMDYEQDNRIVAGLLIPGSVIPKWFSHQNTQGSSLMKVLKPDCYGRQFLGCVFCVVLASNVRLYSLMEIRYECHLITESGCEDITYGLGIPEQDLSRKFESEHIFLWFDSNFSSEDCFSEASFQFHAIRCPDDYPRWDCQVIKCGITFLFASQKQD